ncbi:MAG TPA: enoyl-CoA hydratase/isomerase family protein [Asticcacaulis sp.]|nr:enoyl-CoA hydratase/isomerase family protein [Asticcacaulis sp.]
MDADVLTRVENCVGVLTLNRPKALHALTTDMCRTIGTALAEWEKDPLIQAVMIEAADGTRGFCAGGDIRRAAQSVRGDGQEAAEFFAVEYRLNAQIKRFPKPYIAFIDGITMGGGVGISVHGSYRIATERTIFAMPETGIGLFPDVGGSWFLPRLEGQLGTWLALTGAQLRGQDVHAAGLATHFVSSANLADVRAALLRSGGVGLASLFEPFSHSTAPTYGDHLAMINRCFGQESLPDIVAALDAEPGEWAAAQARILRTRSPLSCCVALRQLRTGRHMQIFEDIMRMEYRIACHITRMNDFSEGVRAALEDKDNAPRWAPRSFADVSDSMVERMFSALEPPLADLTF